ncbi:four-carbon acid sugar kinase family protein [Falsirhodobacter sp. 20TX0035]|uniref:four-carbon acid sugar kinase family protein n=1 Tax=Falsirhodobacter sp. 20TX0035 TaxID=3022019 RepID=UPI00232D4A1A|nr:four-carbon acid sugar kinase family protein [Falsirhodobacter sp. 20TX0035]MDB6454567.1 four-carbon acid sugar kinase family protein [Falsirhodobacter sp. 20TX0035]
MHSPAPPLLAIIADDLTGALDAAAPFAGRGLRVEVALSAEVVPEAVASGAQVISVSTRSREVPADAARAAVATALAGLPPGTRLFKKVDSRLKGNIAAELGAFPEGPALAAPAIPDFGRVVQNGCVCGFGVAEPIPVAPPLGRPAVVPDTLTDDDLHAALQDAGDALLIGARGLARALAIRMTGQGEETAPTLPGPRALLIVGSRDPITMAQVASLDGVPHLAAPNGVIPDAEDADITLIQATQGNEAVDGTVVAANLAQSLRAMPTPDTLFLTGGATAEAVLSAQGIRTLHLLGEVLPGLPVARAGDLTIVAKSGGFGPEDTLVRLVRMIRGD